MPQSDGSVFPSPTGGRASDLLQPLLSPRSVAIVGQSNDATKTAGRPLKFLRQAGYAGRVYPINPQRDTVLGERAWPSLAALPEAPDHIYVVAPTDASIEAIAEGGRLGVKVATVLADGFAEAGEAGAARVARLRAIAKETGIRIVGPSSLGVVNLRDKVMLTANAAFDEADLPAGRFFAASHSGSMIGALLSRGKARGIGFAGLVSVGNEVDLSLGEICTATLDEPTIDGYLLFLETLRHADALRAFAIAAAERGKPILAYKLGRSAAAREVAITHTGALAGEDDVATAFLAACGIARVETLDGMIEGLPLLARVPFSERGTRRAAVGVITTTGGGATMVLDPLATRGIAIEPPSESTLARLAAAGISVKPARLIDLTLAGTRYEVMKAALDIITTAPEFDLIVAVVGSSARFHPELAVKPIVDSAGSRKPIAAYLVPEAPEALAALGAAGVPSFRTPEACADAIAAAFRRRKPTHLQILPRKATVAGRLVDELEAGVLLDRLGIPRAPSVALKIESTSAPMLPFPYPIVVKSLSAKIPHKTEVGGVILNVSGPEALLAAIKQVSESVARHCPGAGMDQVLVQPMVSGLEEVLIGYRVDVDVGPLVMVGIGGVYAEIVHDRSLRLAPVDHDSAREMIGEVHGLKTLSGYRGKPAGDLDALAQAIVALSQLAVMAEPEVVEAEVNPLIVRPAGRGVVAVDALVKVTSIA